jgi:predicted  nucleic acid-binding Zn-ribbon protein
MSNHSLKIKNVSLHKQHRYMEEGLEYTERRRENGEYHMSLIGTEPQINRYLQNAPILSERLRTLNNIPHFRIINSRLVEIY